MSKTELSWRTRSCIAGLVLACALSGSCAFGDDDVPPTEVPEAICPTLDESLTQTSSLARNGQLDSLATVVRELVESQGGNRATSLIRAVITVLGEIGLSAIAQATSSIDGSILGEFEPILASALRPFVSPASGTPEAEDRLLVFSLVSDAAQTCPQGSLTGALLVITREPDLVNAIGQTLRDPALHDFLEEYAGPDSSDSQRAAIVTVLVTVMDAVLAENFQIDDLRGAIDLILPADQAPYTILLDEIARVFAGDNLVTIQTGLGCVRSIEIPDSQNRTLHGGQILAEAITTVLSSDGISVQDLAELLPADSSEVLGTLNGALGTLRSLPQLRRDIIEILNFVATPSRIRGVLEGVVALLDVGGLSEVIEAIAGILGARQCDLAAAMIDGVMGAGQ